MFEQALAACRSGQMQRGIELFNQSMAADRSNIALANRAGGALLSMGLLEAAERILRDAIARFPNDAGTLANLGTVLVNAGRPQDPAHCWTAAIAIDPNFVGAKFNLAGRLAN